MTKKTFLTILFVFTVSLLTAQSSQLIRGAVVDENGIPLPFVHIFLSISKTSTVTNNDGAFSLNFTGNEDILSASFVGYETQSIKINSNTGLLRIQLKPSSTELNEVIISSLSAAGLLTSAIEKIPDNYPLEPFLIKAYYRAKISEADTLHYMEETAFDIVKSYRSSFSDEYFLVRNRNFRFSEARLRLLGIGNIDVVKVAHKFFDAGFFRNHTIRYLPNSTFDNRPVHVLEVLRKNGGNIRGKIYIDEEDLAFVRFEFDYLKTISTLINQYKKIENKYYLMSGNATRLHKRFNRVLPVDANFLTTDIIPSFSSDDIEGTPVGVRDILEVYATQEQDTLFWQQHSAILPDSTILAALEKHDATQRDSAVVKSSLQYQAHIKRLYTPNLSLIASTDLANDFSAFNYTSSSVNRYLLYLLSNNTRGITQALSASLYAFLTFPIQEVTSEWLLLNKNGIQAKMNPLLLNSYNNTYLYNLNNGILSDFKNDNYLDFMRLHTVRNDRNYVNSFLLEEEIAKIDLSNRNNQYSFRMLYWVELFLGRAMNIYNPFKKDMKQFDKSEEKQPLIIDRNRSWVKYLFNPEMGYQRHIRQPDLTSEEEKYLKRSSYWSWLNLVSPQMFLISKFPLGEKNSFTFSVNYLRVPFGEMFGQNIWLMHNHSQLHGIFIKQFRNYNKTTFGIGYKLYDVALFRNMYVTSSVDFWQQPADFDFKTTSSFNGFCVSQIFGYQFLPHQFSGQNRLSLFLGYDYKSKGYMPESFFMEENFNVRAGFKWHF